MINSNVSKVKIYVGTDGKLHFVNSVGADSVLNFNNSKELNVSYNLQDTSGSSKTYTMTNGIHTAYVIVFLHKWNSTPSVSVSASGATVQQVVNNVDGAGKGQASALGIYKITNGNNGCTVTVSGSYTGGTNYPNIHSMIVYC